MANETSLAYYWDRYGTIVILSVPLLAWAIPVSLLGASVLQRITMVLFINLALTLSLQMFTGNSGVLSFTQYGFVAVGAYLSSIFTMGADKKLIAIPEVYPILLNINLSFYPAILLAALVATVVAAVIIWPIVRLSGASAVISTFALLVVFHFLLLNWDEVSNGTRAIFGIQRLTTVMNSAGLAIVTLIVAFWFKESPLGLKLRASREDDHAAQSIGIDIVRARYIAFVFSTVFAGLAGGLWAHFITTFTPFQFYLTQTFTIVAMLIIGGSGSISGAVVGTVVISLILEGLRAIENQINLAKIFPWVIAGFPVVLLSFAMILLLIFRSQGITGGYEIRWRHIRGLFSRSADQSTLAPAEQDA